MEAYLSCEAGLRVSYERIRIQTRHFIDNTLRHC